MSVNQTIKKYLLNKCTDLDALAKRINRDPQEFKDVLDGKFPRDDERNISADELRKICIITESSAEKMLNWPFLE